ncbi:hypothetical protein [Maricaulis maris]|uniref:hypothetical protein n=1 Tax=Maricaulis maris TaxID=74318 RepID=UPI0026EF0063|nr:hypothetical protein [Maricaulis maris]
MSERDEEQAAAAKAPEGAPEEGPGQAPQTGKGGLIRWRFWESPDWHNLLERLAMRSFWVSFAVIVVFALVYALNAFPFNRVFEAVIALAGAALIFAFALKSNDGVMRFLGMMLIAALIISPDDILRLARSIQNQEEAESVSALEADVHRFSVFDTRTVALDLHAMLEGFDEELLALGTNNGVSRPGGKFGNIATINDDALRNFIGCVLDDAVARSVASSMRSSELYQTYRTIMLGRFHEIDFRPPDRDEIDANLDVLKALGVLDYPEGQRDDMVVTRLGCQAMWEYNSLRLEYRRRVRTGASLPCQSELAIDAGSTVSYRVPEQTVEETDRLALEGRRQLCIERGLEAVSGSATLVSASLLPSNGTTQSYSSQDLYPAVGDFADEAARLAWPDDGEVGERLEVPVNEWVLVALSGAESGDELTVMGLDGMDPFIRLYDADRNLIATVDDSPGPDGAYSLDPRFVVGELSAIPAFVAIRGYAFAGGRVEVRLSQATPATEPR